MKKLTCFIITQELVKKFINVTQCEKKYGAPESLRVCGIGAQFFVSAILISFLNCLAALIFAVKVAKFFLDAAKGEHGNQLATAISNYFRDPTFFLPPIAPEASFKVARNFGLLLVICVRRFFLSPPPTIPLPLLTVTLAPHQLTRKEF